VTVPGARDAGESLIELLVTVVILGLATTGISGALLAAGKASTMQRQQVLAQNVLRSWADQIAARAYADCATTTTLASPAPSMPAGFTATVTSVEYWNGGSSFTGPGTCVTDTGIQRVTLSVSAPNGLSAAVSQSVAVVVRKPCVSTC
jgi:Tfp pilus assembly protein PilV